MSASLQLREAKVVAGDQTHDNIRVVIRGGKAQLVDAARTVVADRADVVAVERAPSGKRGQYLVRFADGATWDIDRIVRPCGSCG